MIIMITIIIIILIIVVVLHYRGHVYIIFDEFGSSYTLTKHARKLSLFNTSLYSVHSLIQSDFWGVGSLRAAPMHICIHFAYVCAYIYIYIHKHYAYAYDINDNNGTTTTPGLHNKIPAQKIFARGWVAQESIFLHYQC